nr:MAG TPA: hypothetical protein [Caudoviricetes sp.]
MLYQVWTVSPVRWLSNGRDLQRPSIPILYLKNALLRWGIFIVIL